MRLPEEANRWKSDGRTIELALHATPAVHGHLSPCHHFRLCRQCIASPAPSASASTTPT